ncbi:MAG: hypothetical protein A2W36_05140 [Chloroflexi bacterium RBG_16_58_14]|nr:MAG: hypothetical protein A2W36_05140 [Chloroflexi bacterium RBG_16_58_14]
MAIDIDFMCSIDFVVIDTWIFFSKEVVRAEHLPLGYISASLIVNPFPKSVYSNPFDPFP